VQKVKTTAPTLAWWNWKEEWGGEKERRFLRSRHKKEVNMKKFVLLVALAVILGLSLYPLEAKAQGGPGYGPGYGMGPGYGPGYGMGPGMMYGPGYGPGYGMGPGMMYGPGYGPGYGMGPGMMYGPGYGPGYGMGPGMMYGPGYGGQYGYPNPQKPLDEKEVKPMLENYLKSARNPNLKLGKIQDKGNYFEADIVTKDNSLVDKVDVDKNTGWMRSAYWVASTPGSSVRGCIEWLFPLFLPLPDLL
jgi:hypothetical protein